MPDVQTLAAHCDELLEAAAFEDYCPNGLQIEAHTGPVRRLVTGVTASQALIDAAVEAEADALLVHHGFFWKNESPCLRGMKGRRIATLLRNDVSLLAYHLPLDCHRQLGNNARLAQVLEIRDATPIDDDRAMLWQGATAAPLTLQQVAHWLQSALQRTPTIIAGGDHTIRRIAWCSGAAQGYIEQAAAFGADAYLSGEISEQTTHQARELGIHYLAAGHHATERYGVVALGEHLAERFGIEHVHVDIHNPV